MLTKRVVHILSWPLSSSLFVCFVVRLFLSDIIEHPLYYSYRLWMERLPHYLQTPGPNQYVLDFPEYYSIIDIIHYPCIVVLFSTDKFNFIFFPGCLSFSFLTDTISIDIYPFKLLPLINYGFLYLLLHISIVVHTYR